MARSAVRRIGVAAVLVLVLGAFSSAGVAGARAATPAKTDVMFVFDTTGSMGSALSSAKAQIQEAMAQISASLPDVQYGLSTVADYEKAAVVNPGAFSYGAVGDLPWTLKVPITTQQASVTAEMQKLNASGGGDNPESYGRALFESASNASVGWRPDARGVIVLVADNVPHDGDVNEGIPPEFQLNGTSWNTGADPGPDSTVGTVDDIDWQAMLKGLVASGKPLEFVAYQGTTYLHYWETWTALTGGSAISAETGSLGSKIAEAVRSGASAVLPACPTGQLRDPGDRCVTPPSNNFKIEPRISCSKGCHVVSVKIVFDSAGNVIAESVLEEEKSFSEASVSAKGNGGKAACRAPKKGSKRATAAAKPKKGNGAKCKPVRLISTLSQAVVPGVNTLQLKLTGAALKKLGEKGKLNLKVRFTFAPTGVGGTPNATTVTLKATAPKAHKKKHGKAKGRNGQKS
ncbi:MAG: vWA domain-containing protein [Solirubrobacterales bacterium]